MQPLNTTTTSLKTIFTTPYHIELGTKFNITVRAYTNPGPGEPVSIIVSTLNRPRKTFGWCSITSLLYNCVFISCCRGSDGRIIE